MTDIIGFRFEQASVDLVIWGDGTATVSSLYSKSPGQGYGSGLMTKIVDYADEHNLKLVLLARRFKNPRGLSNLQLVKFYEKFGFVVETHHPGAAYMTREIGAKGGG